VDFKIHGKDVVYLMDGIVGNVILEFRTYPVTYLLEYGSSAKGWRHRVISRDDIWRIEPWEEE